MMPVRVSLFLRAALWLTLLGALASPSAAMLEGSFLYFPTHRPNESALTEWTINGKLVGYRRAVENPRSVWLIIHGNAGQASDRHYIVDCLPADAAAHVLEYPGYGLRRGKPTMKAINAAAREAADELRARYPGLPLGVFGESLGSGAASYLCSLPNPPDRLVLAVPYDNLLSVAKRHVRFLPVGLLMRDKWDNVKTLSGYRGRVEIFGARRDVVIPVVHARNLAASVPQARYVELDCGHNEWSLNGRVRITHD